MSIDETKVEAWLERYNQLKSAGETGRYGRGICLCYERCFGKSRRAFSRFVPGKRTGFLRPANTRLHSALCLLWFVYRGTT